ncbi:MAG: hypothetical protein ABI877_23140, partial [Gemmatimonadaceae bacterium]
GLGLPDKLPEQAMNSLGYNVLQGLKLPSLAAWVFGRNVANYPQSANVHDSYGDGLLAKGDTTGAIAQFKLAVDLAATTNAPTLAESRAKLQKLEKAVKSGH